MDGDRNGVIGVDDAFFLLRVNFRLLYFVSDISIVPVEHLGSACLLTISVSLAGKGLSAARIHQTAVLLNVVHESPQFDSQFDRSSVNLGFLASSSPPQGGIVTCQYDDRLRSFVAVINASFAETDIGISVIQVTLDSLNTTSSGRYVHLVGSSTPPFRFSQPVDAIVSVGGSPIRIVSPDKYNPWITFNNTLKSSDCSAISVLDPDSLTVVVKGPRVANIYWLYSNQRKGFIQTPVRVYYRRCPVIAFYDPVSSTSIPNCPTFQLDTNATHVVIEDLTPYSNYTFTVVAVTSRTRDVFVTTPQDGKITYHCSARMQVGTYYFCPSSRRRGSALSRSDQRHDCQRFVEIACSS